MLLVTNLSSALTGEIRRTAETTGVTAASEQIGVSAVSAGKTAVSGTASSSSSSSVDGDPTKDVSNWRERPTEEFYSEAESAAVVWVRPCRTFCNYNV